MIENLTDLLDQAQINELHNRYLAALDARDAEVYAGCFAPDGELGVFGKLYRGSEQIKNVLAEMENFLEVARVELGTGMPPPVMRHVTTNHAITVSGDHARHRANWMTIMSGHDNQVTVPTVGHYEDELVKCHGVWLFARRVIVQDIPVH